MEAGLGLVSVLGQGREDDARRAEHDRQRPRPVDADAEGTCRLVACGADLGRLVRRRQPLPRQLERVEHGAAPAPIRDVVEERAGRVRGVDRVLARHAEAHVVLRQQHVADAGVRFRLVLPEPEELRRREAGQRTVPRLGDQVVAAEAILDLGALRAGALVVPQDRGADHLLLVVEHDEPVHLAGKADRGRLDGERRERGLSGAPPVLGILLRPARPGRREPVAALGPGDDLPGRRDRECLDRARADVEADEDAFSRHAQKSAATVV